MNFKALIYILLLVFCISPSLLSAQEKEKEKKRQKGQEVGTMIDRKASSEHFIDGIKARMLGDYTKATASFNKSLELDPSNDAAMYELSQIHFSQGDFISAANLIEKAIGIDPENQYYRLFSLNVYGKSGRKEDLLKSCQQLTKRYPGNIDYLYELSSAYLMNNKPDDAIRTYNEIEEILGVTEEISLQKNRIYMLQDKPEKAIREIENLIDMFPDDAGRYYSMLAEIHMQNNKPEIAASYYHKIIEIDPSNPYVHISLADFYRKKGDRERSFDELKLGFANPALEVDTKIRILMAYYSIDEIYRTKIGESYSLSDIILQAHPGDPKALSLNGELLFNDKKYEEARSRFRQVLELDSSRYSIWESLLQTEASLSDWQSLDIESTRAMDLFPFQPLPYFFKGMALMQLKKPEDAIKVLSSGSRLVTSNDQLLALFHANLGDAYNQTSQHKLSDESYEKALKIEPENSYVLNNYAYYLSLRGENLDKALVMARKGAILDSLNPANLDTYGWVFYKMGNYPEAKEWVGKALLLSTKDDPDLLEHYGDILFKLGEASQALEYWNRASKAGGGSVLLEQKIREKKLIE